MTQSEDRPRVVELFAGVGGFRIGLEGLPRRWGSNFPGSGWKVIWHNQWEPGTNTQHAFRCYRSRFGDDSLTPEQDQFAGTDIHEVMNAVEAGQFQVPNHDLLVGGFPCQDYSVAKPQSQSIGIIGVKGVLWWEIYRLLEHKRPRYLFLENVDRLLKSPASQRGRDFAVMLATLDYLGYEVEWRVVNAAEYGLPQKRRRVLVIGRLADGRPRDANHVLYRGTLARAFPVRRGPEFTNEELFRISGTPAELTNSFGAVRGQSQFRRAGYMSKRRVWTADLQPDPRSHEKAVLRDVLLPPGPGLDDYVLTTAEVEQWRYLKGAKSPERTHRVYGHTYRYSEGAIPFPDDETGPARTILTGEGGRTPSRFKHVVRVKWNENPAPDWPLRRLTPLELERLNGFPDDWTKTGMPEGRRAFMMGNALVVQLIQRVGSELLREYKGEAE